MAAIYLIRHGQASFTSLDYDQLSPLGYQQTQLLGEHWQTKLKSQLVNIKHWQQGALKRHHQSTTSFLHGAKLQPPTVKTDAGFNEIDHLDILARFNPRWQNHQNLMADIHAQLQAKKSFQPLFNQALMRWVSGEYDDYQETWQEFQYRVQQAFEQLIAQIKQQNGDTIIFTSAGPIAVILQQILQLNEQQGFALNNRLVNSSVTKLLYSAQNEQISLDYFNNYSHLEITDPSLITYR